MRLSLHKDLASSGWHTSILTTYSVDSSFYDSYVERSLRRYGVRNNILMADAGMMARAMNLFPEGFVGAGSRYAVVPVKVTGAFHPKIHLRLGARKACLVLGSANVTGAGWGKNQEVVTRLNWDWSAVQKQDEQAIVQLIRRIFNYLKHWLDLYPGEAIRYKLEMAERQSPWLLDAVPSSGPSMLSDGTLIDILLEGGGDPQSMLTKFAELCGSEDISRLIIVSPYWDVNLQGFRDLRETLRSPTTLVALNPKANTFPVGVLHASEDIDFVRLSVDVASKFVHAKIFVVQTEDWDHVLFGSANCSDDAIGHLHGPSRNAEASIYRRYPRGQILNLLEIDPTQIVCREEIEEPFATSPLPDKEAALLSPGVFELRETKLTWWPPKSLSNYGGVVELSGEALPLAQGQNATWHTKFEGKVSHPLIARIRYPNGALSSPAIVHCPKELKSAVPLQLDPQLRQALEKAFHADGDLIELAAQAELIFAAEPKSLQRTRSSSAAKAKESGALNDAVHYDTEAAFRSAMLLPATGRSKQMFDSDLGMQDLFALITKGIAPPVDSAVVDLNDEDDAILAGDTEDDVEDLDLHGTDDDTAKKLGKEEPKKHAKAAPAAVNRPRTYTSKEVLRRRTTLVTAIKRFEDSLADLTKDLGAPLSRLPVQTAFIFALLRYAVVHKHDILDDNAKVPKRKLDLSNDESTTLFVFSEDSLGSNRDHAFIPVCARILKALWAGQAPLGSRLAIHATHEMLPDDIFEMVVVSRWALVRMLTHLKKENMRDPDRRPGLFFAQVSRLSSAIYKATGSLGPIDRHAELEVIREKDLAFGYTEQETEEIVLLLQALASPQT